METCDEVARARFPKRVLDIWDQVKVLPNLSYGSYATWMDHGHRFTFKFNTYTTSFEYVLADGTFDSGAVLKESVFIKVI